MTLLSDPGQSLDDATDTELFERLQRSDVNAAERDRVCTELVRRYRFLVRWAVKRYAHGAEQAEEISQVGYLGLVEAIDRFDPARGVEFTSFARPTVLGEIRRHFRDGRRWVRLPRRIQELKLRIKDASDRLYQVNGRAPSAAELADELGVPRADVEEAMGTDDGFAPLSLDAPVDDGEETTTHVELLGAPDPGIDGVVDTEAVWPLLEELPERERELVLLRFFGNKTQTEIADRLGISQMHVSRLLDRTLRRLHDELVA
ncbi:MAG: SigB/SigF/SigG family RNA polymerase sigma factor [Acidothermales bacterium]|nr:SigB/SigF/SigG family RNA polymerase sigma factor [Acidothermales bacterium]